MLLRRSRAVVLAIMIAALAASVARSADFGFFGRSGDAIEVNFAALPGMPAGATYSNLSLNAGFTSHQLLGSTLTGIPFATAGRFWAYPNPAAPGDTNGAAQGWQGTMSGSVTINGVPKTFDITVRPGYTGSGPGSVGQSLEAVNRAANNKFYVSQQQQRLRYFGYVAQGGAALAVDGNFTSAFDTALRTFQATWTSGVNVTQAHVDGIIGPITAGWLNAANAPLWHRLVPSTDGSYVISANLERYGTNWTLDLYYKGSAKAKAVTGVTQDTYGISTLDGYASSQWHTTHRVGTDIDLRTLNSTHNYGDGSLSADEQKMVQQAIAFIDAGAAGRVIRIITSNQDIRNGILALRPGFNVERDTLPGHLDHLPIDVGPPTRAAGRANLAGDYNLDDVVNAGDLAVWKQYFGANYTGSDFLSWQRRYGTSQTPIGAEATLQAIPEPHALSLSLLAGAALVWRRRGNREASRSAFSSR